MPLLVLLWCFLMFSAVLCKPIDDTAENNDRMDSEPHPPINPPHSLRKRYINPSLVFGSFSSRVSRMRTRRFVNSALAQGYGEFHAGAANLRTKRSSEEDCEKLRLCKLHARSQRNFLAAFQLYFVNKENARLWDHRVHSIADCQQRYSGCYDYDFER